MARGRLRVYLGAAPGVGKTYTMLEEAHRRERRGTDVVIGLVQTHGRALTQAMIGDLEVVPQRRVTYRGATFTELDVPAVLARAPRWCWLTNWRTPTCQARATPNAGRTSRNS